MRTATTSMRTSGTRGRRGFQSCQIKTGSYRRPTAFLRSPEASEPDTDIRRATASVQYNKPLHRGNWASAFVWGRNHTSSPGETHNLNGYTFESTVNFLDKNYLYTRLELVDKNELLRPSDRALLGNHRRSSEFPHRRLHLRRRARHLEHGQGIVRNWKRSHFLFEAFGARSYLRH